MKTAELKSSIRFSPDKMQSLEVFKAKQLVTEVHCFEAGQALKSLILEEQERVYLVLEGLARVTVGRTTREYEAGTMIMVAAEKEHGIINIGEQKLVLFSVTGVAPKTPKK